MSRLYRRVAVMLRLPRMPSLEQGQTSIHPGTQYEAQHRVFCGSEQDVTSMHLIL
jgi:hypothetical protein